MLPKHLTLSARALNICKERVIKSVLLPSDEEVLIDIQPNDLNSLNVLHIAGTKGKGSTSAFCSSLLTNLAPNARIGLYTSPHLVAVRERIRINGTPLTEEVFAKYFWEVWDRFETNQEVRTA